MFYGNGLLINKEKNKYKKYVSVLFFKVGDWKPLPKISFIALTKIQGGQTLRSAQTIGASVTMKVDFFCVYLCMDQKRKILVRKTKNKQEALSLSEGAANYLGVPFNNYVQEN